MRKAQTSNREIGLASLIMIVIILYLYFTAPQESVIPSGQAFHEKCELQGNLSCYSVLLRRGSSKLDISITQNTGKLINITSLVCTNKSEASVVMPLLNNTVLVTSGERAYVSGGNSGNNVLCTKEDGKSLPNASLGDVYYGNIYLAYIEVKTGAIGFLNGTLATRYS
ncbi:hypothetical protein H0N99_03340 [Candidatus Micrarchaeota archaeon]|nr:hypothetical protein [Candidatus Micrarchaeota archaeon]